MQDTLERPATNERQDGAAERLSTALICAAAGAVGTVALDRVDWFLFDREGEESKRRTKAVRPNGEPPADVLVTRVAEAVGADVDPATHQKLGVATHYAIGIAPAVAYALFRDKLPVQGVPRGLLYGFALWLLQDEVTNTVTGLGAKPQDYPWQAHARGLAAHLAYGVTTELALNAAEKALSRSK